MSANTDLNDKVIVNPSKIKGLADMLSRAEPGDEFQFSGTVKLDESGENSAVFSIGKLKISAKQDVELSSDDDDDVEADAGEVQGGSANSPVAKVFGGEETPEEEAAEENAKKA